MANSHKVVIIGDTGVGKSSILCRYVFNTFDDNMNSTFGAGFKTKEVPLKSGEKIKLNLWDTAGQERYDSLTKMYFKGAEAAIVVYDITDDLSFEKAKKWVVELEESQMQDSSKIITILVGNKCDYVD